MVTEWGMSDKLGPIFYGSDQQEVFLGHSVTQQKNMSEETANLIDTEVKFIIEAGYSLAKNILTTHLQQLHNLAKALLEYETLTGDEIKDVLAGKPIQKVSLTDTASEIKKSSFPGHKKPNADNDSGAPKNVDGPQEA